MKKTIELLKFALKYGAYITVAVNVINFAIEQFESVEIKDKNPKDAE